MHSIYIGMARALFFGTRYGYERQLGLWLVVIDPLGVGVAFLRTRLKALEKDHKLAPASYSTGIRKDATIVLWDSFEDTTRANVSIGVK
jgi:hypothetical protein